MKLLLLVLIFTTSFKAQLFAQQVNSVEQALKRRSNPEDNAILSKDAIKHMGNIVYVRDTIFGYKIINPSLKFLYFGGEYPNQKLTVFIKGKRVNKKLYSFKKGLMRICGKIIMYKDKPIIIVTSSEQTSVRIQL